jgi:hypothetical protein
MADFNVTIDDGNYYDVRSNEGLIKYNLGVNYEIPTKSNQYNNLILDDISSSFNGSNQLFSLTVNGEPYFPINEQQLIISLNDVIQNPGIDYQVSDSNIYFFTPPTAGLEFFGIALATTADLTRTINVVFDNGSIDIQPGSKGYLNVDVTGTIESWTLVSETEGTISIDIQKTTYDNFPNGFSSIVGSEFPLLINQDKNKDDNLSTWNTQITAGDILDFRVLSCTGISKCSVFLRLRL